MAAVDDVDELIKQHHLAADEFAKGNPELVQKLFSHRKEQRGPSSTPLGGIVLRRRCAAFTLGLHCWVSSRYPSRAGGSLCAQAGHRRRDKVTIHTDRTW